MPIIEKSKIMKKYITTSFFRDILSTISIMNSYVGGFGYYFDFCVLLFIFKLRTLHDFSTKY